jgi:hypothetical protein
MLNTSGEVTGLEREQHHLCERPWMCSAMDHTGGLCVCLDSGGTAFAASWSALGTSSAENIAGYSILYVGSVLRVLFD